MWSPTAENPLPSQKLSFLTEVLHRTAVSSKTSSGNTPAGDGAELGLGAERRSGTGTGGDGREGGLPRSLLQGLGAGWGQRVARSKSWALGLRKQVHGLWLMKQDGGEMVPSYAWRRGLMPKRQHLHPVLCSSVHSVSTGTVCPE